MKSILQGSNGFEIISRNTNKKVYICKVNVAYIRDETNYTSVRFNASTDSSLHYIDTQEKYEEVVAKFES